MQELPQSLPDSVMYYVASLAGQTLCESLAGETIRSLCGAVILGEFPYILRYFFFFCKLAKYMHAGYDVFVKKDKLLIHDRCPFQPPSRVLQLVNPLLWMM